MAPQEDSYEKELDAYFVDRLRLANDKEQRAGLLKQRFKERNSLAKTRPGGPGDDSSLAIVCVDGSPASNEALRFALHHLRTRFVVLAHGIRVPLAFGGPPSTPSRRKDDGTTQDDAEELHRLAEQQYLKSCQEAGKHCLLKHFTFTTHGGFGHAVCSLAHKKGASAVVVGQRYPRPLLGASSAAVVKLCRQLPVVLVPQRTGGAMTEEFDNKTEGL